MRASPIQIASITCIRQVNGPIPALLGAQILPVPRVVVATRSDSAGGVWVVHGECGGQAQCGARARGGSVVRMKIAKRVAATCMEGAGGSCNALRVRGGG